jgi:hypothetical protein
MQSVGSDGSFETSVIIYQLTRCHIPEDLKLQEHHRDNLKSTFGFGFRKIANHR